MHRLNKISNFIPVCHSRDVATSILQTSSETTDVREEGRLR